MKPLDVSTLHQVRRWTAGRKQEAVEAIARGDITRDQLMAALSMNESELAEWERDAAHGKLAHRRDAKNFRHHQAWFERKAAREA